MSSLRSILMSFFTHKIEGTEPRIVELEQPIKIIGMSIETDVKRVYRDVSQLGKQFEKYKQQSEIPNRKQPWAFAAVSKDFDEGDKTFSYIWGTSLPVLQKSQPAWWVLKYRGESTPFSLFAPRIGLDGECLL